MFRDLLNAVTPTGRRINPEYLADEADLIEALSVPADCGSARRVLIEQTADRLVQAVRRDRRTKSGLDALLHQFDLSSAEGVALMCLAEALLRIPDPDTADLLIADRIQAGDWANHLRDSDSLFVNASTWALMLTGELLQPASTAIENPAGFLRSLAARIGEPLVRAALRQAMRVIGDQFVMGRDIAEAIARAQGTDHERYRHSFDMLGEAALTAADASRYLESYLEAIITLGRAWRSPRGAPLEERPSISVKLSALHPRFEWFQRATVMDELVPQLAKLAQAARSQNVPLTVDAEEGAVLELSLEVFAAVASSGDLRDWDGFGIAVQAYQRRAPAVIHWLRDLARDLGRSIPVRLVKGAYWDTEIKRAQEQGLASYPVFTRKVNTDISYLACARLLLDAGERLHPQFATHNAHAVAWVIHNAAPGARYEFQRLHGMGQALYDEVVAGAGLELPCRVYAPVGRHEDLLPYLVRRLLENGANSSFVNRIVQDAVPIADIIADPVLRARATGIGAHPSLPAPTKLYGATRPNSVGLNLADSLTVEALGIELAAHAKRQYQAQPRIDGRYFDGTPSAVHSPADGQPVGSTEFATGAQVSAALDRALAAFPAWSVTTTAARGVVLRRAADLIEASRAELTALCVREAGRCIPDALDEVREAVDFLRYYAAEADRLQGAAQTLPGPTGERNELRLQGRGVFICISPWNFPLAIFTGQVAAALAAGNAVIAKPAEQTSLVAARVTAILHEAGIPDTVVQFLPGDGETVGARLVADSRIAGVLFTGSTATARSIHRALAEGAGPAAVLVAETGGQNAMVVDSSALPEQVVRDAIRSAFNSAGQRCSSLRVLVVQEDIAARVIEMLQGCMAALRIGDPGELVTDVGPVIDATALQALEQHRGRILGIGRKLYECELPRGLDSGYFFPPLLVEIASISDIKEEIFGPILHVLRYPGTAWPAILDDINGTGYGLTCGLHSRIERRAQEFADRVAAGNVYINRNMIGAVVGVQPFGGRGLSGSGPKAGGPHYLSRLTSEQTITTNIAAVGGNTQLMARALD